MIDCLINCVLRKITVKASLCLEYNFTEMSYIECLQGTTFCAKRFTEIVSSHSHNYVSGHYLTMIALQNIRQLLCKQRNYSVELLPWVSVHSDRTSVGISSSAS